MTPPLPTSYTSVGGRKMKDFAPSLGSIGSQAPVSPSAQGGTGWDTEAEHILSFFLSGDAPNNTAILPTFATTLDSDHDAHNRSATTADETKRRAEQRQPMDEDCPVAEDDDGAVGDEDDIFDVGANAPPTPALRFYGPSDSKHQPQHANEPLEGGYTGSSSRSLGLSSGSLPPRAPLMQFQQQQQQQQLHQHQQIFPSSSSGSHSPMDHSPISPAALIGPGHENLLLPSHDHDHITTVQQQQAQALVSSIPRQPSMSEQERHLAWLRDINAMAKAAAQAGGQQGTTPTASNQNSQQHAFTHPPTQQQQPQQPQLQHHPQIPPHHVYAQAMYAHAAAVAASVGLPHSAVSNPAELVKPPVESAEKRAKRLERNRESARRSRRKKKERLETLEAQVNKLNGEIETERRKQINAMVPRLNAVRHNLWNNYEQQQQQETGDDSFWPNMIRTAGCNNDIVRAVVDFQHTALKQVVLPRYQKMLIWLSMQEESYFSAGKEEFARKDTASKQARATTGKISSKQIGEEIANGGPFVADETTTSGKQKKRVSFQDSTDKQLERPQLVSYANDAARVWPLLCFDLAFSVDQEDRFLAAQKRAHEMDSLTNRSQMAAAVQTSDRLYEAVESLGRVVSQREDRTVLSILSPTQVGAYQKWLSTNRARVGDVVQRTSSASSDNACLPSTESSLHDICKRLNEVLQISKSDK